MIAPAIELFLEANAYQVDPIEWISDKKNIVLINDKGDMGLFEPAVRQYYSAHYYFKSRGRDAINSALEILDVIFHTCYNIPVMTGLVPEHRRDVKLTTRRLGFTSYGTIHCDGKPYELFILRKEDFKR